MPTFRLPNMILDFITDFIVSNQKIWYRLLHGTFLLILLLNMIPNLVTGKYLQHKSGIIIVSYKQFPCMQKMFLVDKS